jgi:hypothetical protein
MNVGKRNARLRSGGARHGEYRIVILDALHHALGWQKMSTAKMISIAAPQSAANEAGARNTAQAKLAAHSVTPRTQ